MRASLGAQPQAKAFWHAVKERYTQAVAGRPDWEIAESFYNSVTMRVVPRFEIDPAIEYVGTEFRAADSAEIASVYTAYPADGPTAELIRAILLRCGFACPYADLDRDAERVAAAITRTLDSLDTPQPLQRIELVNGVFYRGQGAYLVGRICAGRHYVPLVLALHNGPPGIYLDAVLLTEDEVSILFSFARSYFHVEVETPYALVRS